MIITRYALIWGFRMLFTALAFQAAAVVVLIVFLAFFNPATPPPSRNPAPERATMCSTSRASIRSASRPLAIAAPQSRLSARASFPAFRLARE